MDNINPTMLPNTQTNLIIEDRVALVISITKVLMSAAQI